MSYPTRADRTRMDLWRRREEAHHLVQNMPPEASDSEIIEAAADYLLLHFPGNKVQFSILHDATLPPVEYDWNWKNVYGITTIDPDRACLWIFECMRLGYGVFASRTKRGYAVGPGSIKDIRQRSAQNAELMVRRQVALIVDEAKEHAS